VEEEIMAGALLSRLLLEIGEDDDAYTAFSRSMQLADRNGLKFMTARLLNERAQYYYDQGDFMHAENANGSAAVMSRSAGMPWTTANCVIRGARLLLRMGLPIKARENLTSVREQLRQFPNAALSAQITELEDLAKHTRGRPEPR
jgi:hypothetical protein